jgi:hypothetical protein
VAPSSSSWQIPLIVAAITQLVGPGIDLGAAQIGPQADAAIERCLGSGKVLRGRQALEGVTRPVRLQIACEGGNRSAVFKTLDSFRRGLTRLGDGTWEMNFIDSYRLERAAYLVDRELGLNMVPVAVIREIRGEAGALIDWIPDALHEEDIEPPLNGIEVAALAPQKAMMHLFDALIYNTDRNTGNWLIGDNRRQLFLIDHSRSFRYSQEVPEAFIGKRLWLTRGMYDGLAGLNRQRLIELLAGLIDTGQIDAMLRRRDRVLEMIDAACAELGEDVVIRQ